MLRHLDGVVVVDAGRLRSGTPVVSLLTLADCLVLVSSPEVSAAVASVEWLRAAGRVSPRSMPASTGHRCGWRQWTRRPGWRSGRMRCAGELGAEFGAWLPWDPTTVDLVHRGVPPTDRRLRRNALLTAIADLVVSLPLPVEVAA